MTLFNIAIEPTSHKNIVKFVANSFLTDSNSFEFSNVDEAKPSLLAQQLFYLPFVKKVFISQNFVAIEKYEIVEWEEVEQELAESIAEYLNSGKPVISDNATNKKIPVTVYAESTPNPGVMKFVASKSLAEGTSEYKNIDEAIHSPLAQELFNFPFVKEVFISGNYVSVMKYNVADWEDMTMELREFIRKFIESGKTVISDARTVRVPVGKTSEGNNERLHRDTEEYTKIEQEIISILDEYVTPAVAKDGGHIMFESFNENTKTVRVVLQGACSGCPSSTLTLKNGIETMLQEMLNGRVKTVEAINA